MKIGIPFLVLVAFLLGESQQETLKEFSSTEGGFVVLMPGTPLEERETLDTEAGPIDLQKFILELKKESIIYMVYYWDYSEVVIQRAGPDRLLDSMLDWIVSNIGGKLLSEQIISLDSYPGREIEVEAPEGFIIRSRLYLVKQRMYQLIVATSKEEAFSENAEKFFKSFKLLAN